MTVRSRGAAWLVTATLLVVAPFGVLLGLLLSEERLDNLPEAPQPTDRFPAAFGLRPLSSPPTEEEAVSSIPYGCRPWEANE